MISGKGCTSLATALRANPYHLSELDLSYNHPGNTATKLLSAGVEHQHWKLKILRQEIKMRLTQCFCVTLVGLAGSQLLIATEGLVFGKSWIKDKSMFN